MATVAVWRTTGHPRLTDGALFQSPIAGTLQAHPARPQSAIFFRGELNAKVTAFHCLFDVTFYGELSARSAQYLRKAGRVAHLELQPIKHQKRQSANPKVPFALIAGKNMLRAKDSQWFRFEVRIQWEKCFPDLHARIHKPALSAALRCK